MPDEDQTVSVVLRTPKASPLHLDTWWLPSTRAGLGPPAGRLPVGQGAPTCTEPGEPHVFSALYE